MNTAYIVATILVVVVVGGLLAYTMYRGDNAGEKADRDISRINATTETITKTIEDNQKTTTTGSRTIKTTKKPVTTQSQIAEEETTETKSRSTMQHTTTTLVENKTKNESSEEATQTIIVPTMTSSPQKPKAQGASNTYIVDEVVKGSRGWIAINALKIDVINKTDEGIKLNITIKMTLPNPCWKIKTDWSTVSKDKSEPIIEIRMSLSHDPGKMCVQVIKEDMITISIDKPLQSKPSKIVIIIEYIGGEKIDRQITVDLR
ncbi:MAG: hypothetical protein GSR85_07325 [Desulfurococcales archaeon]|nr:hypothetical protein [Desulfurococcales archaeon]